MRGFPISLRLLDGADAFFPHDRNRRMRRGSANDSEVRSRGSSQDDGVDVLDGVFAGACRSSP
jgi:hypothetical protein